MNLYLTATGRYVGTQAEAKKAGKGWTPETVPTDKEGLIAYLNATVATAKAIGAAQEPAAEENPFADTVDDNPFADVAPSPDAGIKTAVPAYTTFEANQIVEFLLDRASQAQVELVFAAIGTRWGEAR